jgi:hypothetical protein
MLYKRELRDLIYVDDFFQPCVLRYRIAVASRLGASHRASAKRVFYALTRSIFETPSVDVGGMSMT